MPAASAHLETVSVAPEADSQEYDQSTPVTTCAPKMRTPSGGLVVSEGASPMVVRFGASGSGDASPTSRAHPAKAIPNTTTIKVAIPECVIVRISMLFTGCQEDTLLLLRLQCQAFPYAWRRGLTYSCCGRRTHDIGPRFFTRMTLATLKRRASSGRRTLLVLGSSLSSGPARRRLLRIRLEDLEDGIGDAPLEAPQRLLAGLALRDLLTVVGPAPRVRPGLAYRDHVQ